MGHESSSRGEGEARDPRCNRAGKARLDNAVNEVAEPTRYSQHTNLGTGIITDKAKRRARIRQPGITNDGTSNVRVYVDRGWTDHLWLSEIVLRKRPPLQAKGGRFRAPRP